MQPRSVILLVVALVLAGGTAFLVNGWLAANRQVVVEQTPAAPPPPRTEVLVVKEEIATGTFLRSEHLRWQTWPEDGVAKGYIVRGKGSEKDLEGAVVRARLYAGEPVTPERVVHRGEQGFLAAVLEPGKRAVALPVDATRGVGGFIFPGDLVDVLLTVKSSVQAESDDGAKPETRYFSQTLLAGVRVIGIDQAIDSDGATAKVAKTATVEVTPKEAERITIALELGELSLTLHSIARNDGDATAAADNRKPDKAGAPAGVRTYTRDTDVLDMMGDPWGLPYPNGVGPKVTIVRGGDAKIVRF